VTCGFVSLPQQAKDTGQSGQRGGRIKTSLPCIFASAWVGAE